MVNYRLAKESDYEKINAFHNRIYKSNRTLEQFYWEFHNCPFGKSIYVIAEDDDKIVGTNCVIPIELIDRNNRKILSGKSEDTLVDPDYRGQKIFYKIYEFLFEKCREANIDVIWGFTSAIKPFTKLGFEIPFNHLQSLSVNHISKSYDYLKSLNPSNKLLDKFKILGLCVFSKMKGIDQFKKSNSEYTINENQREVKGVDGLISRNLSTAEVLFAINQSSQFQNWRIYDNPNFHKVHTYRFLNKDQETMALIVFNSHPNQIAYVSQSTFHPALKPDEKTHILQHATGRLFSDGIHLVRTWHFRTNSLNRDEIETFNSSGYTVLNRGLGFVWKELRNVNLNPNNFFLSRIATQGKI